MPFVGDVFGLNTAYDRQVSNIEQRNVLNWPEYPTYGYFVGGTAVNAPAQSSTIARLDLTTNVSSLPGRNLPVTRSDVQSFSNNYYGYFGGGALNTIVRLDFSNETVSLPGKNLTQLSRANQATASNSLYGYFGGGYAPALASIISRLEFSSETVSNPGKNFSPSRANFAAVSSNTYGYFGGGYTPTLRSTITRLDFSNETLTDPGKNLPTGIGGHSALSNISYGYFGGGGGVCTINRLDFSNETVSLPGKNLPTVRRGPLVFSDSSATGSLNGSYGYFGGGGVPTGSGITDIIQRIDFVTENIDTLSAVLGQQVRQGAAVANSRSSFKTNSKTYGYFGGSGICAITRLDFSNETMSLPGKDLPTATSSLGAFSSNYYGYFGGGYQPSLSSRICTIRRLDFSNETISLPGKDFPTVRDAMAATSSNSYGYFGGGYRYSFPLSVPALRLCAITRLDFSTENLNVLSGVLPGTAKDNIATVSNNFYGYFCGGFRTVQNTDSIVTRLDFSSETVSNPVKNLLTPLSTFGAFSSNSYGYFGGGYTAPSPNIVTCTVRRLDFSNETISLPGKNLPFDKQSMAGSSSAFNGYFSAGQGGFFAPVPNGFYADNLKLDFSSETITSIPATFPSGRSALSAVSNSN